MRIRELLLLLRGLLPTRCLSLLLPAALGDGFKFVSDLQVNREGQPMCGGAAASLHAAPLERIRDSWQIRRARPHLLTKRVVLPF